MRRVDALQKTAALLNGCYEVALNKVLPTLPQAHGCGHLSTIPCQHSGMCRVCQPHLLLTREAALPFGRCASRKLLETTIMA